MNLFKIQFVMALNTSEDHGNVMHTLEDSATERIIHTLDISAEKLQSVSNYAREPRRLTFEYFTDSWIDANIRSGENEFDRYISHYKVKVYRDTVLIFTGIIDTSQLSYSPTTGIIKFTCYDMTKLLTIFSDLTHFYSLSAGYTPSYILGYFLQDIEQTIDIDTAYSDLLTLPEYEIENPLTLFSYDYADMLSKLPDDDDWTYTVENPFAWSWAAPWGGLSHDSEHGITLYASAWVTCIKAVGTVTLYKFRAKARVGYVYNNTCIKVQNFDNETDWVDDWAATNDSIYKDLQAFLLDYGISSPGALATMDQEVELDNRTYNHAVDDYISDLTLIGEALPASLFVGKYYEDRKGDELTDNMKALQAMLLLYNATLYTNAAGTIILSNKDAYDGTAVAIDDNDVISITETRVTQEMPDMKTLEVLAGDTTVMQAALLPFVTSFYASKFSISATIDQLDKYALVLLGKITIKTQDYAIVELERDYIKDEYKIKAWKL